MPVQGRVLAYKSGCKAARTKKDHPEERLLDQAQTQAPYTPFFGGGVIRVAKPKVWYWMSNPL